MSRDLPRGAFLGSIADYVHDEDLDDALTFTLVDDEGADMGARWLNLSVDSGALSLEDARAYCHAHACDAAKGCASPCASYVDGDTVSASVSVVDRHDEELIVGVTLTMGEPSGILVRSAHRGRRVRRVRVGPTPSRWT